MPRGNKTEIEKRIEQLLSSKDSVTVADFNRVLADVSSISNVSRVVSEMFGSDLLACLPYKIWNDNGTPTTVYCKVGTEGSYTRTQLFEMTGDHSPQQPKEPWIRPSQGIETEILNVLHSSNAQGLERTAIATKLNVKPEKVSNGLNALHAKGLVAKIVVPRKETRGCAWAITKTAKQFLK